MKKLLVFGSLLSIIFFIWPVQATSTDTSEYESVQVIPDEAIRLRILANSDHEQDQEVKELIRDEVSEKISTWVEHITDIDEARKIIRKRIPELDKLIAELLEDESHTIEYRSNVTFPAKLYDSILYPAGEYEAILITIGDGDGTNWWCVLFPPLCFLDFDSEGAVADTEEEDEDQQDEENKGGIQIKFFLFEWLGWT